uniref:hypothetical protein n=1 Tax=Flavobacterium sp. TaxID=239 RepID=UPI004049DD94
MIISKVISYKGAWNEFEQNHQAELEDIVSAIPEFIPAYLESRNSESHFVSFREIWDQIMFQKGWEITDRTFYTDSGQRINLGSIGPVKNGISSTVSFGHVDHLNRWLFQQTALAGKYHIADIPILIVPIQEFARAQEDRFFQRQSFEMCFRQIEPLAPLSHAYPFLILGYSDQENLFDTEVFEIESDPLLLNENIVIDRCIEFPPEFHQAGLNILSFFGTYIREQYPDEDAKVKIEQNGHLVKLIIETKDGKKDVIEKALHEYELVVTGEKKPEEITQNQGLILELRNELRIAKFRIESQQDIIHVQRGQMDQLFNIVGSGLANKQPIAIDFRPNISLSNSLTLNQDISYAISGINEIKELLPSSSPEQIVLNDLEGALEAIEKESNPDVVKKSSAMSKFRKFLDKVKDGNEDLKKVIETTETGVDIFRDLAGKYNKIAEWCGLPQVPSLFTK